MRRGRRQKRASASPRESGCRTVKAWLHTRLALSLTCEVSMSVPAGGLTWADLGFCLLAKGNVDRAGEILQKGLSTPAQQGLVNRPRFLVGLAYVAVARTQLH